MDKLTLYIAIGRLRKSVLKSLDKPKTASQLSKTLNTHRSTINQILLDFSKKGLVKKLNPKDPFNVFYQRTPKGEKVVNNLKVLE